MTDGCNTATNTITNTVTNSPEDFKLAPLGVLRAAAWPLETLQPFGDSSLATLARQFLSQNPPDPQHRDDYHQSYAQVLERERSALWQLTSGDPRFMKTLLLSNPLVAGRVGKFAHQWQQRTKPVRRLEHTLYRYLARAVGRTTPGGLWCGVTPVTLTTVTEITPQAAAYWLTPDLRPFQTLLRHLGQRSPYWERTTWQVNPSLVQVADGSWQWWARTATGGVERYYFTNPSSNLLLRELQQLDDEQLDGEQLDGEQLDGEQLDRGTFAELAQRLAPRLGIRQQFRVIEALQPLPGAGILLGGLDLPSRFSTPWEALTEAGQRLEGTEQSVWQRVVGSLQDLCRDVGSHLEIWSYEQVATALSAARQQVQELAAALGMADLPLPDPLLHCDYRLPWQVSLGVVEQQQLRETLAAYEREWLQSYSPATVLRQSQQSPQSWELAAPETPEPAPLTPRTWTDLLATHPEIQPHLQTWEALLASPEARVQLAVGVHHGLPLAPWGCLYLELGPDGRQLVHGISDYATQGFARLCLLVDPQGQLQGWCRQKLGEFAQNHGLRIAELHAPLEANPNVLARPDLGLQPLSLWSQVPAALSPKALSMKEAQIHLDPQTRLPLLHLPGISEPVAVMGLASAHIAGSDPVAERLLQTGFQASPRAIFRATTLPTAAELAQPRCTPEVCLSVGATIRPRRTLLSGEPLAMLLATEGAERYAHWQHLAAEYVWPPLVQVEVGSEAPLLVPRDSPLALAALFKALPDTLEFLVVTATESQPWLVDAGGKHYRVELAQPFQRRHHGWSDRRTDPLAMPGETLPGETLPGETLPGETASAPHPTQAEPQPCPV